MSGTDVASATISLRARYAMSDTDAAYAAIRRSPPRSSPVTSPICLCARYAMSGTGRVNGVRYWHSVSVYARARQYPVLAWHMVSSTDVAYRTMRSPVLRYLPTHVLGDVRYRPSGVCGTDTA
eukprot:3330814-Rhodomonas_salina.1